MQYGGLTLTGCYVLTKATLSFPLLSRAGEKKSLWVKIGMGRDHAPVTIKDKT